MYYLIYKNPFDGMTKCIRSLFDSHGVIDIVNAVHKVHLDKAREEIKGSTMNAQNRLLYPLDVEPKKIIDEEKGTFIFVYSKDFVNRGWVYNTTETITTTFEYILASYDNIPENTRSFFCTCEECETKRKAYTKKIEAKKSEDLISAILSSPFFVRRKQEVNGN